MSEELEGKSIEDAGSEAAWALLRKTREARGLSLAQVSANLKLTVRQLEAIESGDLTVLPGQTFARGFVRNYARFLELDPALFLVEQSLPEHNNSLVESSEKLIGAGLGQMPLQGTRRFSALPAVFLVVLLLIVLGSGWHYGWFEAREERSLLEKSVQVLDPQAEHAASAVVLAAPPVAPVASVPVAEASVAPAGASAPAPAPLASPSAASSSAAAQPVPPVAPSSAPPAAASQTPAASGLPRLVFSFDGDSWVEVRDASDRIVFARLNSSGSVQEVQGTPPFVMVIGNAPHVRLSWRGAPVDLVPATRGEVARLTVR